VRGISKEKIIGMIRAASAAGQQLEQRAEQSGQSGIISKIKKAEEKIKAGSRYLVTQVVLMSDETEKRLLEIHYALHHTKIKIYPCLSLLKDFRKDSLLLKKICPFVPQEILSRKQDIQDNNKKAVEFFQRLFDSDTMYLFQFRKP